MKTIKDKNVKEMMMNHQKKKKYPMKFVYGKMVLKSVIMNQSLMWKEQTVNFVIELLWNMYVVFVGSSNIIIKVVHLGNGISHIIMPLLHLISSTYQQYRLNLKKGHNQYVFFFLIIYFNQLLIS